MKIIRIGLFVLLFLLSACGKEMSKPLTSTTQTESTLKLAQCNCDSSYSPVCGSDKKNYDNKCIAQCFGLSVNKSGHCDCSTNQTLVCGKDGLDHTECDAIAAQVEIVKYIPCAASEL
jgi:hypothetical protein